jgi:hypothetical protein
MHCESSNVTVDGSRERRQSAPSEVITQVEAETKARWLDLCAEIAVCDDPDRFAHLTKDIIEILQREELRLRTLTPENRKLRN